MAEERIKQKAKAPFDSKGFPLFADSVNYWRGLDKVTEKSLLRNGWVKVEEVLQILKEQKVKWRELLKLLLEPLAELEHEQWIKWSKSMMTTEKLSEQRLERWKKMWIPYAELDEKTKEYDRVWARKVLQKIMEKLKELQPT